MWTFWIFWGGSNVVRSLISKPLLCLCCASKKEGNFSMEMILQEIERALNARLFYMAIVLSLMVPDICAGLESDDGRTSPDQYRDWYTRNLADKYRFLTAEDCYSLRCGVIHQGRFGHGGNTFARVIWTIPNERNIVLHRNIMNDAFNLDAVRFCRDVVNAARTCFRAAQDTANVHTNLPRLVTFHPTGLAPYIVGLPVIA